MRGWSVARRAAGFMAVGAVVSGVVVAARHDPDAAATAVRPAASTAWLPSEGSLVLADARSPRPLSRLPLGRVTSLAQAGTAAIVLSSGTAARDTGASVSIADGSTWARRTTRLPEPDQATPTNGAAFVVAGPSRAWVVSPAAAIARPVALDRPDGWLGDPVPVRGVTSEHQARVTDDGTLWTVSVTALRAHAPGRPARTLPLDERRGARALTLVDGDPVVIEADRARRFDRHRDQFAPDWPLALPRGPLLPAERSQGRAVVRTATHLGIAGPDGTSATIPLTASGPGSPPVERDGLLYLTDRSARAIDVYDPTGPDPARPVHRIPVPGDGELLVTGHHEQVWFYELEASGALDPAGLVTPDFRARLLHGREPTSPDGPYAEAGRNPAPDAEISLKPDPPPLAPGLDLDEADCARTWPTGRCPTDPGRLAPGGPDGEAAATGCPRSWPTANCTVTGFGPPGPPGPGPQPSPGPGDLPPPAPSPPGVLRLPRVHGEPRARALPLLEDAGLVVIDVLERPSTQPRDIVLAVYHDGDFLAPDAPIQVAWRIVVHVSDGTKPVRKYEAAWTDTSCVHTDDELVACWGYDLATGIGGDSRSADNPDIVAGEVIDLSVGRDHACVVRRPNRAYCWGDNIEGQLGDGTREPRSRPVAVAGDRAFLQISAGHGATCAVDADHDIWCWGKEFFTSEVVGVDPRTSGALDRSVTRPIRVPGVSSARSVHVGQDFACALLADTTVRCWGSDIYGQMGQSRPDGTAVITWEYQAPVAPRYPGTDTLLAGVTDLAVDWETACAVVDRVVRCWGKHTLGPENSRDTGYLNYGPPHAIPGTEQAVQVTAEYSGSCAAFTDGSARCWGAVNGRHAGDPSIGAAVFNDLSDVRAVFVAGLQTCAVRQDQSLWCWGAIHGASGSTYSETPKRIGIELPR